MNPRAFFVQFLVVVFAALTIAVVGAQAPIVCRGALTEDNVMALVAGEVAEARQLQVVAKCGVAFGWDAGVERRLRAVGATARLLAAVREMAGAPGTARPAPAASASDRFGLTWVAIPAGTFEMGCVPGDRECDGDESPRHAVTISRGFTLTATEVTVAQYRAAGGTVPVQPSWSGDRHPMVNVTRDEARAFCAAVGGRLPTEAEWEYAARGGRAGAVYPWGNEVPVCTVGAATGARFGDCGAGAVPVGTFRPNGYGLYDVAANVWEWVADWYGEAYYRASPSQDPPGPASGALRVVRGGSWNYLPRYLRVSYRLRIEPGYRGNYVGFRCAR